MMSSNTRPWWRWLLPSLTHWLWLMLLLVLLAQPWRTMMVASDGDPSYHWRVGAWMLEHRQIIRTDVFSHTCAGQPYVDLSWLADLIFAIAGHIAGLYGLAVVAALLIATTFALLHRQLLRDGNHWLVAMLLVLLALPAASLHWLARPLLFTHLIALLWNGALRSFERGGDARRLLMWLGTLMLLWVNLHAGFFIGFFILGAYWLGALIERDRYRLKILSVAAPVCALVSLATPYGYRTHLSVEEFVRSDYLLNWFGELSSSQFSTPEARGFLIWLAVIFFTLVWLRPKLSASSALLLISWTYLALYAVRNVPVLTLLSAPILAPAWSEFARNKSPGRWTRLSFEARGWPVVALAGFAAICFVPRPTTMPAKDWPVAAVEYVRQHEADFTGHMFNQYIWGGYLLRELPKHPVFVDGRADFYGEDLIREFSDTTALRPNWAETLQKYQVQWTLMPARHRLNLALAASGTWSCVYSDEVAMVWRRKE